VPADGTTDTPAPELPRDVAAIQRARFKEWEIGHDSAGTWSARLTTSEERPQPRALGADEAELARELMAWHEDRGSSLPPDRHGRYRIELGYALTHHGIGPSLTELYLAYLDRLRSDFGGAQPALLAQHAGISGPPCDGPAAAPRAAPGPVARCGPPGDRTAMQQPGQSPHCPPDDKATHQPGPRRPAPHNPWHRCRGNDMGR